MQDEACYDNLLKKKKSRRQFRLLFFLTMLKVIIDLKPTLIVAEGAKTPAGGRGRETPQALSAVEAPRTTREPHAPGAEINSQVKMLSI
jgi:hypothetical protein